MRRNKADFITDECKYVGLEGWQHEAMNRYMQWNVGILNVTLVQGAHFKIRLFHVHVNCWLLYSPSGLQIQSGCFHSGIRWLSRPWSSGQRSHPRRVSDRMIDFNTTSRKPCLISRTRQAVQPNSLRHGVTGWLLWYILGRTHARENSPCLWSCRHLSAAACSICPWPPNSQLTTWVAVVPDGTQLSPEYRLRLIPGSP